MLKKKTVPQVIVSKNILATTSINIAEVFGKLHKNILRDIEELLKNVPAEWGRLNFEQTPYKHPQNGEIYPMYLLTRDAFTLLVMGFTGKKALQFKLAYITEFNRMQELIRQQEEKAPLPDTKAPQLTLLEGQLYATSLNIAEVFGKTHTHVLRDIRLLQRRLDKNFYSRKVTEDSFFSTHFQESSYQNALGTEYPLYYLSRTGLTLLLMTYSSPRYFPQKRQFLETFLQMENQQKTEQKALPHKQVYFYIETLLEHLQKYRQSLLPQEKPSLEYLNFIEHSLTNILTN